VLDIVSAVGLTAPRPHVALGHKFLVYIRSQVRRTERQRGRGTDEQTDKTRNAAYFNGRITMRKVFFHKFLHPCRDGHQNLITSSRVSPGFHKTPSESICEFFGYPAVTDKHSTNNHVFGDNAQNYGCVSKQISI